MFIRCRKRTKERVVERSKMLGVKYADLVRWALRWVADAPRDELMAYSMDQESNDDE